jgi:hypothetical protein
MESYMSEEKRIKNVNPEKRKMNVDVKTAEARGWKEVPEWAKPKVRKCLWCGSDIKDSSFAGDRYHLRCRETMARYG